MLNIYQIKTREDLKVKTGTVEFYRNDIREKSALELKLILI